uniref:Uncharacterized protein n=1 Tax=Theileria annulata TaxID=5874 RepID=A0A3B0MZK5_THEAN
MEAVGDESGGDSLRKALATLGDDDGANPANLPNLAKAVRDKYGEVKDAYDKVTAKQAQYTAALKTGTGGDERHKYTQVTDDFTALEGKFNAVKSVNSIKAITPIYDKPWIRQTI